MAIKLSGMISGMDTESMVTELMKAQNLKKTKIQDKITTTQWKQEKWNDLNQKIYAMYTGTLSKMRLQSSFKTKNLTSSDDNAVSATAGTNASNGIHSIKVGQLASSQFVTGSQLSKDVNGNPIDLGTKLVDLGLTDGTSNKITITTEKTSQSLTITDSTTVIDVVNTLKSAGLNASYDASQKRFFISSKDSGTANAFSIQGSGVDMTKLGLDNITYTKDSSGNLTFDNAPNVTLIQPKNAVFKYNDAEMTSSSNVVTVNGLTLTLKNTTAGYGTSNESSVSLNVKNNVDDVYNTIKAFIINYNAVLMEMNKDYDAPTSRGYDPLSDDEKEKMTDSQIEKWESKIKDSLLRRDDNLRSLTDTMRSSMGQTVQVNGKSYSLATFGIASANYTEKGLLHINGDSDDSLVSASENSLKKALQDDPDTVMNVMNTIAGKMYSDLTDKMKSTTMRSALKLYNDKELSSNLDTYKKDLSNMEKKLDDIQNRYYKQFAAMESAMAKLNSQSSSFQSMLGTK